MSTPLEFEGSNCLRQRIGLSILSGKTIAINRIRINDDEPGLSDFEVNLLRLMEKITNGTSVQIDESGTHLEFIPGLLVGGTLEHDCCLDRSISYYLELLLGLAPFCKNAMNVTLTGITNDAIDPTVDALKVTCIPILTRFLKCEPTEIEIKILSRGLKPKGGGSVNFKCPIRRSLKPIQWLDPGKIKRIRGVAYACRVSPQVANRMVDTAKGALLQLLPDVYIQTEHMHGAKSGRSPGFGILLYAESTTGAIYTGEAVSKPAGEEPSIPEDVAQEATDALFQEIFHGGCADSSCQGLALLLMALGESDLSKIRLGPLSPFAIQLLRHMKELLKVTFKLDSQQEESQEKSERSLKIVATCVGVGFTNLSKTFG